MNFDFEEPFFIKGVIPYEFDILKPGLANGCSLSSQLLNHILSLYCTSTADLKSFRTV